MKKDDFYNKDKMAENVDKLMNDMTVFTADRRRRDAEMLSMIREKQASPEREVKPQKKLFGSFSRAASKKNSDEYSERENEYTPDYDDNDGDGETVLLGDYDDDATVLLEESGFDEIVFTVNGQEQSVRISDGKLTIGSDADRNDIVINSRHVSRRHAELSFCGGYIYITDMGSTNGTYINGSKDRIDKNIKFNIDVGDFVVLADAEFIICEYRRNV